MSVHGLKFVGLDVLDSSYYWLFWLFFVRHGSPDAAFTSDLAALLWLVPASSSELTPFLSWFLPVTPSVAL
jgi:hypothetical protein